jgi:hypothetical protein
MSLFRASVVVTVDVDVGRGRSRSQDVPKVLLLVIRPQAKHALDAAFLLLQPPYSPVRRKQGPSGPVQLPGSQSSHLGQRSGQSSHHSRRQIEACCPFGRHAPAGFVPPQGLHATGQRVPDIVKRLIDVCVY